MKRRFFLRQVGTSMAGVSFGMAAAQTAPSTDLAQLTILHTNDVHSRVDPFPMDGGRNQGMGGAVRRAKLIEDIRSKAPQTLLLDSGDIFQGTPYFNFFGGELEFKLMSQMRYDAATIGNHDFDAGIDGLLKTWNHAQFPFVISNYDFSDTDLNGKTKDTIIFDRGPIRVGIFGLGIELESLVPANLYGNTRYLDPISVANDKAKYLRKEQNCDYVICLSHLGYRYRHDKIDDRKLASQSKNINLILGGHTHTFLMHPEVIADQDGQPVLINQAGWGGIQLGRIDVAFELGRPTQCATCENLWIT